MGTALPSDRTVPSVAVGSSIERLGHYDEDFTYCTSLVPVSCVTCRLQAVP